MNIAFLSNAQQIEIFFLVLTMDTIGILYAPPKDCSSDNVQSTAKLFEHLR